MILSDKILSYSEDFQQLIWEFQESMLKEKYIYRRECGGLNSTQTRTYVNGDYIGMITHDYVSKKC